jgi:hypothetical protein
MRRALRPILAAVQHGPSLGIRRYLHSPDITIQQVSAKMYRANADFVFAVTRDFLRACQTPILILPDDIPPHPYAVAMEGAMLAPNAQVSIYPGKDVSEKIPLAVRHIRTFLQANRPMTAAVEQRAAAECVILGREFVPFVTPKLPAAQMVPEVRSSA